MSHDLGVNKSPPSVNAGSSSAISLRNGATVRRGRAPSAETVARRARARAEAERLAARLSGPAGTVLDFGELLELVARASVANAAHVLLVDELGLNSPVRLATLRRLRLCRRYFRRVGAVVTLQPRWIEVRWPTGRLKLAGGIPSWEEARRAISVHVRAAGPVSVKACETPAAAVVSGMPWR